jgi:hypothetical protein
VTIDFENDDTQVLEGIVGFLAEYDYSYERTLVPYQVHLVAELYPKNEHGMGMFDKFAVLTVADGRVVLRWGEAVFRQLLADPNALAKLLKVVQEYHQEELDTSRMVLNSLIPS